jgi:hypothetical protein
MAMSTPFREAVVNYFRRGWMPTPLGPDSQGFPKRPIAGDWPNTDPTKEAVAALPWGRAIGIGVVLGPISSNLAVIDIDDVGMANATVRLFASAKLSAYLVSTVRKRLHVYLIEETPSPSRAMTVTWGGNRIKVELKARGTQVAAPPTPGYSIIDAGAPLPCPNIWSAWQSLALKLGIAPEPEANGGGNYPQPWQDHVKEGERNNSAYIEAHRLREAGIPLDQAREFMVLWTREHYDKAHINDYEVRRTVESAYRKGIPPSTKELWDEPGTPHFDI